MERSVAGSATASGASRIIGSRSSTSKTRSKLTIALMMSTRTLESAVSGPYRRESSRARAATSPGGRGRWAVQGRERRGEGTAVAGAERAVERQPAAEPVDQCRRQRRHQGEGG